MAASIGAHGRCIYLNFEEDYFWKARDFKTYFDKGWQNFYVILLIKAQEIIVSKLIHIK